MARRRKRPSIACLECGELRKQIGVDSPAPYCIDHIQLAPRPSWVIAQTAEVEAEFVRLANPRAVVDLTHPAARTVLSLCVDGKPHLRWIALKNNVDEGVLTRILARARVRVTKGKRSSLVDQDQAMQRLVTIANGGDPILKSDPPPRLRDAPVSPKPKSTPPSKPDPTPKPTILTTQQLAKRLDRSVQAVHSWVKAGCPQHFASRGGGKPSLFDLERVNAWRSSRKAMIRGNKIRRAKREAKKAREVKFAQPPSSLDPEVPTLLRALAEIVLKLADRLDS